MNEILSTPQCIGFILDGNRRYAKERGQFTLQGHEAGLENLERILEAAIVRGVPHIACYAFSTENWRRSEEEVDLLMILFAKGLPRLEKFLEKIDRRATTAIRFCGQLERFTQAIQHDMHVIEARNPVQPSTTIWLLLSYGGHAEIVHATRKALEQGKEITEAVIEQNLWTVGMPASDMIIRTGGDERLSGFLLWQSAYSEIFFTKTLWPAFTEHELDEMLAQFAVRQRRFGK